jgi:hypothetical protein
LADRHDGFRLVDVQEGKAVGNHSLWRWNEQARAVHLERDSFASTRGPPSVSIRKIVAPPASGMRRSSQVLSIGPANVNFSPPA